MSTPRGVLPAGDGACFGYGRGRAAAAGGESYGTSGAKKKLAEGRGPGKSTLVVLESGPSIEGAGAGGEMGEVGGRLSEEKEWGQYRGCVLCGRYGD